MKLNIKKTVLSVVVASMLALPGVAFSADFEVAAAMNFKACLDELITEYTTADPSGPGYGLDINATGGQAGIFEGNIRTNPNLYQLFFSADEALPQGLIDDSLAEGLAPNTSDAVMYAKSDVIAYGGSNYNNSNDIATAITNSTDEIGICDPAHGPYGALAEAYLLGINVAPSRIKYYQGLIPLKNAVENSTNPTKIGFVTPSIVYQTTGAFWTMPGNPNPQGACLVLQTGGTINADAQTFLNWIITENAATTIIQGYGFQ